MPPDPALMAMIDGGWGLVVAAGHAALGSWLGVSALMLAGCGLRLLVLPRRRR